MPNKRLLSLVSILTLIISLSISVPIAFGDGDGDVAVMPEKSLMTYPNLSTHLNHLVEAYSSGQRSQEEAAGEAPIHLGGSVAVTVHLDGHVSDVVAFLGDNGGDVRNEGSNYIEAYVPVGLLGRLSEQPGVARVWEIIPPQPAFGNVTSQAVTLHQADSWQNSGFRGQGVKVGVIDVGFTGYSSLMGVELPNDIVARCYTDVGVYSSNLSDCEAADEEPPASTPAQCQDYVAGLYAGGEPHGTAVAEALIDIAPDAALYIANPYSNGDLQATAAWMADQGVTVINHSVSWTFDGPGDGTSPFSFSPLNTVDQAVARGITWLNAAGNSAGDTWFGSFSDPDGDGAISFSNSTAEINSIVLLECQGYTFALRWEDDWGGADTDLDIYLWDRSTGDVLYIPEGWGYVGGAAEQSGAGNHYPWEFFSLRSPISSRDVGVIIVHESGPEPDWIHLELFSGPEGLEYSTGVSISNPAESDNLGLLAVGAAPFYNTNIIEPFSSQGPTPDGRVKPDIVGVDCAASVSYEYFIRRNDGQGCWFPGTSQASPHVAGMAALVRQRFPEFTAEQVAGYLKDTAQQRELPDPNNTWGHGFARLPPLTCGEAITGDGAVSGTWAAGCDSEVSGRGHARYYSFTVGEESEVTITLNSDDADTYIYLRQGDATSGPFLHENDDHGGTSVSQIQETLAAGTYTIEATTYSEGATGSFTLTVGGLGGGSGTEPESGGCSRTITSDGTRDGTWASGCESTERSGRHARFYSFTLEESSEVTITLNSDDADTFLYLREGEARSGAFLHENDDDGGTTRSRIQETLAAGSYTIEATTYAAGETGSFTLTVSGLGAAAPGPGIDPCGQAITVDGSVSGTWAGGCDSAVSGRGHAHFYTFTLNAGAEVTITLVSSEADTYLYLREGEARSGAFLHENDDDGGTTRSRIQETLAAGSYTIEATTYAAGETGSFTLTVSGLGAAAPGPGIDPCGQAITVDGSVSGTWAGGCDSAVSGRGHAHFYTFTLNAGAEVTITLVSSEADTYLYLREGEARSGAFLHENDDDGGTTRSRIQETLAAGSYTIEATTYAAGETGSFTLTVSGLGATAGPGPGADCYRGALPSDGIYSDQWEVGCESETPAPGTSGSGARLAHFYTFTLNAGTEITIVLESGDADTYLYLRQGEARSGAFLHENDDDGGTTRSRIQETLAAGSYTIEATTYAAGETGSFTLTVSGLDATAGPGPGADCYRGPLPSDGIYSDQWEVGCESETPAPGTSGSGARFAYFYTFTLNAGTEVTIVLESGDADTYLYLRQGEARFGAFLHENDDDGGTTRSRIQETLAAGSYTIEATTYAAGETGSFTLTVSGLGAAAPGPKQTIVFLGLNWNSAQLQNRIAQYIVETGYGYPTGVVFASTLPLFQGLRAGDIHVAMEIWLPNQSAAWEEALASGEVISLGASLGSDWQSAFVIPAYLQEQYPEFDNVQDLKEQRYKALFQTAETGGKARLESCVVGWDCEHINAAQVTGYGLDEHVHIVDPESQDALFASINGAYQRREPWLGYMWGTGDPALLLDLVRLEEPPYRDECWDTTRACAYKDNTILIGAHSSLPEQAPEVVEFLRKWDFPVDPHLRNVFQWQEANPDASIEDVGLYWVRNNADAWSSWVTSDAAARIRSALSLP